MIQQLALSPLALLAWGCFPELLVLRCSHFSSKLLSCFVAWPSIQIWVGHISIITRMYWVREITDVEWTSLHWISLDNRKRPLAHKSTSTCQVPLSPSLGCQQSKKEFINEIYLPPPLFLPLRKVTNEKSKCGSQVDTGFICDSGDRWGLCAQVCSSESSGLLCLPALRWPLGKCSLPSRLSSGWVCSWGQESEAGCAFPISTCLSALGLILTPRQRLWKSVPLLIVVRDWHSLGQKPNWTAFYVILYLTVHNYSFWVGLFLI